MPDPQFTKPWHGVPRDLEDDLAARSDILAAPAAATLPQPHPHPYRIIALTVTTINHATADVLRVNLSPETPGECFCEFTPGQYIELWQPDSTHLSRSYSIANSPHGDGSIELHIRRVDGGRFTEWAFGEMKVGDRLQARGPLGIFTMRSPAWVPLLFVVGGTGFALALALIEQQVRFDAAREMTLVWGMRQSQDFYALDTVKELLAEAPNLRVVLVAGSGAAVPMTTDRLETLTGTVLDALRADPHLIGHRDIYAAGPPAMLGDLASSLYDMGVEPSRIHIDSFGV